MSVSAKMLWSHCANLLLDFKCLLLSGQAVFDDREFGIEGGADGSDFGAPRRGAAATPAALGKVCPDRFVTEIACSGIRRITIKLLKNKRLSYRANYPNKTAFWR